MLVGYNESAIPILCRSDPANKLTKINGPETCPGRQVDHPLRPLDRRQVEFSVQQREKHLVQHIQAVAFRFIVGEQVR